MGSQVTKDILEALLGGDLTLDGAFQALSNIGYCPNLLNDDNGHWAVSFQGFQNAPLSEGPTDITTTLFVKKDGWQNTIHDALVYALNND